MKTSLLLVNVLVLFGCAHSRLSTPSGAGVNSGIGRTQASVEDARRYNDLAVIHNANARTRVERIEAKAEVIGRYWGK